MKWVKGEPSLSVVVAKLFFLEFALEHTQITKENFAFTYISSDSMTDDEDDKYE